MSSLPPSDPPTMGLTVLDVNGFPIPTHYKSYRKKWRKMSCHFLRAIDDANDMFIREHKAWDIAKRLQEQNDQILDTIHDLELDGFPERHDSGTWQTSVPEAFGLGGLEVETAHSAYPDGDAEKMLNGDLPSDLMEQDGTNPDQVLPPGYFTFEHEMAYLAGLDATLNPRPEHTQPLDPDVEAVELPTASVREKRILREQDFAIENPNSVRNWLRKNKPEMFMDKEKPADKNSDRSGQSPAPPATAAAAVKPKKKTKAELAAEKKEKEKQDLPFESLDEDIGFDAALDQPAKGKRKRDDNTYRPKGGNSRAAKKRKVEEVKEDDGDTVAED